MRISTLMVLVGGRHIWSIDIFYNGQCSIKLSSSIVLCIIFIVIYFVTKPIINYICPSVSTRSIRLMLLLLPQVSLMLPWVCIFGGGFIEWVPCCHLLLNTGSEPAMTKGTKRFTAGLCYHQPHYKFGDHSSNLVLY